MKLRPSQVWHFSRPSLALRTSTRTGRCLPQYTSAMAPCYTNGRSECLCLVARRARVCLPNCIRSPETCLPLIPSSSCGA